MRNFEHVAEDFLIERLFFFLKYGDLIYMLLLGFFQFLLLLLLLLLIPSPLGTLLPSSSYPTKISNLTLALIIL